MQFIQDTNTGGRLGQAFATGLQNLAQNKLQMIQGQYERALEQQRYAKGIEPVVGSKAAQFLSSLGPDERKLALQNIGGVMHLLGSPQQQQMEQGALMAQAQGQPEQLPQPEQAPGVSRPELIQDIFTSPHERREKEKLELKRSAVENQLNKEAREYIAPYAERSEAADKNIKDYNLLIKLAESNKLRAGNTQQLMSKLGLAEFGRNFETQLADKLTSRLAQNAQTAFGSGSRITNYLEQTFQRSLPSLWNTKEGIVAISKLNKFSDEAILEKQNAREKIIKENKGKVPYNIEAQVREITRPTIDKLEQRAISAISNPGSKYTVGERFSTLPSPASVPAGTIITNKKTGKSFRNNGNAWEQA